MVLRILFETLRSIRHPEPQTLFVVGRVTEKRIGEQNQTDLWANLFHIVKTTRITDILERFWSRVAYAYLHQFLILLEQDKFEELVQNRKTPICDEKYAALWGRKIYH